MFFVIVFRGAKGIRYLFPGGVCISLGTALIGLRKGCLKIVKFSFNPLGFAQASSQEKEKETIKTGFCDKTSESGCSSNSC